MPKVSIVIPVFNRAELVSKTLDSVLSQTYRDYEVIAIDDGSTDASLSVLNQYQEKIRIIPQRNLGVGAARNAGIHAANGEYIAFIDSDDLWYPHKLERQLAVLESRPEIKWIYSDCEVFNSESLRMLYLYSSKNRPFRGDVLEPLLIRDFIASPTPVIHRDVIAKVGDFSRSARAQDWDLWLRIAVHFPIEYVPEPLARYRIHQGSSTSTRDWRERYALVTDVISQAVERNPDRLAHLKSRAVADLNIRTGQELLRSSERIMARSLFLRAIRLNPSRMRAYAGLIACFLDEATLKKVFEFKDKDSVSRDTKSST